MTSDPRCSSCGARVRPDAPWCTQCYAPLVAPGVDAVVPPGVEGVPALPGPRGPVAPPVLPAQRAEEPAVLPVLHGAPAPTWPCLSCGTANPLDLSACTACGAPFLVAERPHLVLPVVGDVAALPRAQRLGAAVLVVLLVLALTAALAAG